jgi:hypothetical protein
MIRSSVSGLVWFGIHGGRALARSEHFESRAQGQFPPAIIGRGVDPEDPARRPRVAELIGQAEQRGLEPALASGRRLHSGSLSHRRHEPAPWAAYRSG